MKNFLKKYIYLVITLVFVVLLFYKNLAFKNCIINGCSIFFHQVFPSLFPMFIINDILINYNFFTILDYLCSKIFHRIFHMSSAATYIFILSIFSGTPTNAYIATNLVNERKLSPKDAGIILSYSCFLNPLFLYNMLNTIFLDSNITLKIIFINYGLNFFIAFCYRKYNYQNVSLSPTKNVENFTKVLAKSIERSLNTLTMLLGTIIFYFIICEGISIVMHNPLLNCIFNGLLEATGGLAKIASLNINMHLKEILVSIFISFGGFSIHTQIKNIISDVSIPYKYFFVTRIIHAIASAAIFIIA